MMNENKNILEDPSLKCNPFSMPDGYIESLEDALHEQIATEEKPSGGFIAVLKPALLLAAMFALIFAMGYGVLSLTDATHPHKAAEPSIALLEEGLVESSFIDFYEESDESQDGSIDEDEILDYLSYSLSYSSLAEAFAQIK